MRRKCILYNGPRAPFLRRARYRTLSLRRIGTRCIPIRIAASFWPRWHGVTESRAISHGRKRRNSGGHARADEVTVKLQLTRKRRSHSSSITFDRLWTLNDLPVLSALRRSRGESTSHITSRISGFSIIPASYFSRKDLHRILANIFISFSAH